MFPFRSIPAGFVIEPEVFDGQSDVSDESLDVRDIREEDRRWLYGLHGGSRDGAGIDECLLLCFVSVHGVDDSGISIGAHGGQRGGISWRGFLVGALRLISPGSRLDELVFPSLPLRSRSGDAFSVLGADGPTLALEAPPSRSFAGEICHLGLVVAAGAAGAAGSAGAADGNEAFTIGKCNGK